MNDKIRLPSVTGTFYPDKPADLRLAVSEYLNQPIAFAKTRLPKHLRALIVPHAGYIYSGPVAGKGYALLKNYIDKINRIWLIGPSHQAFFQGLALASYDFWQTPLGLVLVDPINQQLAKDQSSLFFVDSEIHQYEHSLEVQLPFLLTCCLNFSIIPILTGEVDCRLVNKVMDKYIGENDLLIISSDLSHYLSYQQAIDKDKVTIGHITKLQENKLLVTDACGLEGIKIVLDLAKKHHWQATLIDYRNSGDTAGNKDRVVGYASIGFWG